MTTKVRGAQTGLKEPVFEIHKNVYLLERERQALDEYFLQNPQSENYRGHCKKLMEIVAAKGDHGTVHVICGRYYLNSVVGDNLVLFGIRAKKDCIAIVRTSWNCGRVMPPILGNFTSMKRYVRSGCDPSLLSLIEKTMIDTYMSTACQISTDILGVISEPTLTRVVRPRDVTGSCPNVNANTHWVVICGRQFKVSAEGNIGNRAVAYYGDVGELTFLILYIEIDDRPEIYH